MIPNLNLKFFLSKEKNHIICPNVENNNRLAVNWDQISLLDKTNLGLGCLDTKESMTEASEILSGRLVGYDMEASLISWDYVTGMCT